MRRSNLSRTTELRGVPCRSTTGSRARPLTTPAFGETTSQASKSARGHNILLNSVLNLAGASAQNKALRRPCSRFLARLVCTELRYGDLLNILPPLVYFRLTIWFEPNETHLKGSGIGLDGACPYPVPALSFEVPSLTFGLSLKVRTTFVTIYNAHKFCRLGTTAVVL